MARSGSWRPILGAAVILCIHISWAATITYDFNITWVLANPDGLYTRPVIGINNQFPIPAIVGTLGDRVIVNVNNQLGNQSTSLHFHGLFQNGTTHMDGPVQVTQCEIPPGSSYTYNFTFQQTGTYWYHSHLRGQYPDGIRGPMIIHDPDDPYKDQYDEEVVLTVSDWYHGQMATLLPRFVSRFNPTGAEPIPDSAIWNDTPNTSLRITMEPGKTYLFRMVNIGAFVGYYIWFDQHSMRIVEVDGVYHDPAGADMIYLAAAQRCSVLVTAQNQTDTNYALVASMDQSLLDRVPDSLNPNATAYLVYNKSAPLPDTPILYDFEPFDDIDLVPVDKEPLFENPDNSIELTVVMNDLGDGANYAFFNNISYVNPKVPTLYTALTTGAYADNPAVYGEYTHAFVLQKGQVVEIVINNNDSGRHPFHLHGHNFQAVLRSDQDAGNYQTGNESDFSQVPMRRDTFMVYPHGNFLIRFRADNPDKFLFPFHPPPPLLPCYEKKSNQSINPKKKKKKLTLDVRVWLFHCHIDWHLYTGLVATMVEAPRSLQESLVLPPDHLAACKAASVPYTGNAAGNTVDFLDLDGENKAVAPLPDGFTPRGIVALVCSCVAAFIGMALIAVYGSSEITSQAPGRKTRIA